MSDQGVPDFYSFTAAPLLVNEDINDVSTEEQDSLQCHCQAFPPSLSKVIEEIKQLYAIALPMIITGLLLYGKLAISMFSMGKLGKEALAGGSMSIGIANITGYSVISGLALGMEAISSRACGAKQWPLMGQTLQRTFAILILACLPISVLWLNIEPILLFFRQDPDISSVASTYLALSLPDLLFQCIINPLRIYLRTQNVTLPLMLTASFALALHAPINYILVYHLSFGIRGIAVAVALTDLNLLLTLVHPELHVGVLGMVVVRAHDCPFGSCTNASESVATMGILIQATSLIYIFPSSLSLAVSARVGNELGANRPTKAKTTSMVALLCAVFSSFTAMLFMITMRNAWGRIFTDDKAILSLTAMVMPVAVLCELGNYPQTTGCGVLRGSARPALGANINLGSFYGVGLPVALLMGFIVDVGLLGLWFGLLAAQGVCAIYMVVVVARTDWRVQATRAGELTGINGNEDEEESKIQGLISVMVEN
ncbi:ATP-dependent RNA helicase eIF4A isoform 1 [Hibiscus syriacus]|uniref:Protein DETOXIFICATION n=1 Tax=Hibiscus syriacus TaxID=106335 RepID=A0A6A2Z3R2_HIBSY|nr:ATP-dependent RNA helicase eIF4A isoform 1 [Hibiscus syriacus]